MVSRADADHAAVGDDNEEAAAVDDSAEAAAVDDNEEEAAVDARDAKRLSRRCRQRLGLVLQQGGWYLYGIGREGGGKHMDNKLESN